MFKILPCWASFLVLLTKCPSSTNPYLEPEAYLKPTETLTRHFQNPATGYYSAIFRTLGNACIRRNRAYSESWNIQDPSIITSLCIFRTLSYLRKFTNIQNCDIFKTRHIFKPPSKI